MDIGEIISESIRYPLNDTENIKYPLIVFALLAIPLLLLEIATIVDSETLALIFLIIFIVGAIAFILIAPGYLISVTREGINRSGIMPAIEIGKNIVDTLKLFVISFIYSIIPAIVITILMIAVGSSVSSAGIDAASGLFVVVMIIAIILEVIFGLLLTMATLRFANTESLSEALSFSEVYGELKQAGILKLLILGIVLAIIATIIALVGGLLSIIPIAGIVIAILIYAFICLFESYAIGLFYSDVAE
jgi:hypothetical protein